MTGKRIAKTATKKKAKTKATPPKMQNEMEELLRQFTSMLGADEVIEEDVKALLASLDGPSPHDRLGAAEADAKGEAQQIAFDAMEAESAAQARKLAKRALRLDPDCVDALVVLVDLDARTERDRIEDLQRAVAAGERSLGAAFLRENKGDFWLLIETRPYMRALAMLGGELAAAGMSLDAIGVYEKMLELNPNDNQGVRGPLLGLCLAVDDMAGAGKLLKRYKGDASACFAWGRVLERFLAGSREAAGAALQKAIKANRFVALHVMGHETLPTTLPEMYSPGSVEEAVLCQHYLGEAWVAHPEACFWLGGQLAEMGMMPILSKTDLKKMKMLDGRVQ